MLDAAGQVDFALGDVRAQLFPRSCSKLMQATALVEAGWDGSGSALALAASSHAGSPSHVAAVRALLGAAGLTEADLQTPADWPLDPAERDALLRRGGAPAPVLMNCSGKHAAMLATCVQRGWSSPDYLSPEHPVQVACREQITRATGVRPQARGTDGCGAPLYSTTLLGLATAYRSAVTGQGDEPARSVADAMRGWPELVSGPGRFITEAMRAVPGLLVKDGAEGVCAGALGDGRAFALKVDDGALRAMSVVACALLARLEVGGPALDDFAEVALLGGGIPVGAVRPASELRG